MAAVSDDKRDPWWVITLGIAVLLAIVFGGALCYRHDVFQYL